MADQQIVKPNLTNRQLEYLMEERESSPLNKRNSSKLQPIESFGSILGAGDGKGIVIADSDGLSFEELLYSMLNIT